MSRIIEFVLVGLIHKQSYSQQQTTKRDTDPLLGYLLP
jgi:hypothetical protein